jgi:hypothetical protein
MALLEASAYVQQRRGNEEGAANSLKEIGMAMADLGHYTKAQRWLKKALTIYQTIDLHEQSGFVQNKITSLVAMVSQVSATRPQSPIANDEDTPREFVIQVNNKAMQRLIVTISGEVQWYALPEFDQLVCLDLVSWKIICTNP